MKHGTVWFQVGWQEAVKVENEECGVAEDYTDGQEPVMLVSLRLML